MLFITPLAAQVITSSLHSLSEADIDDIAAYYETINLDKINPVLNHIPLSVLPDQDVSMG
jgi:hypothetical protein